MLLCGYKHDKTEKNNEMDAAHSERLVKKANNAVKGKKSKTKKAGASRKGGRGKL